MATLSNVNGLTRACAVIATRMVGIVGSWTRHSKYDRFNPCAATLRCISPLATHSTTCASSTLACCSCPPFNASTSSVFRGPTKGDNGPSRPSTYRANGKSTDDSFACHGFRWSRPRLVSARLSRNATQAFQPSKAAGSTPALSVVCVGSTERLEAGGWVFRRISRAACLHCLAISVPLGRVARGMSNLSKPNACAHRLSAEYKFSW